MMSLAKRVEEWADQEEESPRIWSGSTVRSRPSRGRIAINSPRGEQYPSGGAISSNPRNFNGAEKHTTSFRAQGEKGTNPQPKQVENRRTPYRRLSDAEANERRAKGLCFKCDERYHPGHQCRRKEFRVLIIGEDGIEGEFDEEEWGCAEEDTIQEITELAELSLNSAVGISSPRTIKLKGMVKQEETLVLIDSGASHNFISEGLVKKLGITTKETRGYGVLMGTGLSV